MYLIAIDEAGYGPKLGPLVVAGSVWQYPHYPADGCISVDTLDDDSFSAFTQRVDVGGVAIRVDDSKQIFRSQSAGKKGGSLVGLNRIVSVAHHLCQRPESTLSQRMTSIIPADHSVISKVPWLATFADSKRLARITNNEIASVTDCQAAIRQWSRSNWKLLDVRARMIDAGSFNRFFQGKGVGKNKSDLLSETSIGLAVELLKIVSEIDSGTKEPVQVFFDRHGGRKFYAAPIQQAFSDRDGECPLVQIIAESPRQSVYDIEWQNRLVRLHFTVKGDRFTPVALSSLHAKYLREVAMASLNQFFGQRYTEYLEKQSLPFEPLRPTAGYPTDAERFLQKIEPLRKAANLSLDDLVRSR